MLRPLLVLMLLRQGAFGQRCQSDGYRTHRRLIELRFQEPLPRLNVQRLPQERRTRATYLSCNIFPEKMDKCRTSGHAMPLWEACTGSHANANHASPSIFKVVSASTALVQPKTAIGVCCAKSLENIVPIVLGTFQSARNFGHWKVYHFRSRIFTGM